MLSVIVIPLIKMFPLAGWLYVPANIFCLNVLITIIAQNLIQYTEININNDYF